MPPNPRLRLPLIAVVLSLVVIALYRASGSNLGVLPPQRLQDGTALDGQSHPGYRPPTKDFNNVQQAHHNAPDALSPEADLGSLSEPSTTPSRSSHGAEETASRSQPPVASSAFASHPYGPAPANARNAIVTAVWDASYASFALMLGWSIQQHNNLTRVAAELVLLTLDDPGRLSGLTAENKTRLERVGWKIRSAKMLKVPGVNIEEIAPHRRLNLNKLQQFGWEEYDKIVYIDADAVCKSSIEDLFAMPGEFAAAPDVWFDIPIDSRSNSGVMVFKPSRKVFADMIEKLPKLHDPHEGDQNFLQEYWKYRDYKLPFKYNLNIVMHEHFRDTFNRLWEEAAIVHYTIHKPTADPDKWCASPERGGKFQCLLWPILEWYRAYFIIMRESLGLENEIPVLG